MSAASTHWPSHFLSRSRGGVHLRALSPKRAWYQHMEVGVGCGGGDRGRKGQR